MKMGGVAVVRETVIMQGGCGGFLSGIERTLRERGTWVQRILCAAMMALLSMAELPGGGYCCQSAMFAVLLRQGFCVPAAFTGVMASKRGSPVFLLAQYSRFRFIMQSMMA